MAVLAHALVVHVTVVGFSGMEPKWVCFVSPHCATAVDATAASKPGAAAGVIGAGTGAGTDERRAGAPAQAGVAVGGEVLKD